MVDICHLLEKTSVELNPNILVWDEEIVYEVSTTHNCALGTDTKTIKTKTDHIVPNKNTLTYKHSKLVHLLPHVSFYISLIAST